VDWEAHVEGTIGKLLQATFGLWNALLTVNGIMLTVFAALYALVPGAPATLAVLLVGSCVVSICLIVFNHVAMKSVYYRTGEVLAQADRGHNLSDAERTEDLRRAERRHTAVTVCENLALVLFVFQVLLVAGFVYAVGLQRAP